MRTAGLVHELARRHSVRVVAQQWSPRQRSAGRGRSLPAAGDPASGWPAGVGLRAVPVTAPRLAWALRFALRRPLQVALHRHREFCAAVRREFADFRSDVSVVVLSRLGDVLGELSGGPVVVDLVDALAANMARRAAREPWLRALWSWEGRRMDRWDRELVRASEMATVVAERDWRHVAGEHDALAAKLRVVPLGLPLVRHDPFAGARRPIVAVTGNLGYFPTVDGVRWFARRVWPRIRQLVPEAEWWLAGARPARAVRQLATLPAVRLFADPDDLGGIVRRSAVAVAPLRSGSGTPIKVLEAMASSVPVVTTVAGLAGLDDLPAGAVVASDRPEAFARAVAKLLSAPRAVRRQVLSARRWLGIRHDREVVGRQFEAVLEEAVERFQRRRSGDP